MDTNTLWRSAMGELEVTISSGKFNTWFSKAFVSDVKDDTLTISFPSIIHLQWFEKDFKKPLTEIIRRLSDGKISKLKAIAGATQQEKKRDFRRIILS